MTIVRDQQSMMLSLPEATVAQLLSLRERRGESLAEVVARISMHRTAKKTSPERQKNQFSTSSGASKYVCELLGTKIYASTLGSLFGNVVDILDELAPESLLQISERKVKTRRILSRKKDGVHISARHLPVLRTNSGWWISKNISKSQTVGNLRALCLATGIKFGSDMRFPL